MLLSVDDDRSAKKKIDDNDKDVIAAISGVEIFPLSQRVFDCSSD